MFDESIPSKEDLKLLSNLSIQGENIIEDLYKIFSYHRPKEYKIYVELIKYNPLDKNKIFIDINQVLIEGNTLLILAAREGNYQITKFLCEENADVNIQNNEGNTALHYAIGKQFYSLADILTMHGAKEDLLNLKGYSPWDCIEHAV